MCTEKLKLNILDELRKAMDKEVTNSAFRIVEIDLAPAAHEKLRKELEAMSGKDVHMINTLFGIPVVIDGLVPQDKMWVIKRKRREE